MSPMVRFPCDFVKGYLCLLGIEPFNWRDTVASSSIMPRLQWAPPDPERLAIQIDGFTYACSNSWLHVTQVPQDGVTALFSFLNTFDFHSIDLKHAYRRGFTGFLNWLLQQVCALYVPWPSVTEPLEGCLPTPPSFIPSPLPTLTKWHC
jgi:hypothetical protein